MTATFLMCRNIHCPSCMSCLRFTALPNEEMQSYAGFAPKDGLDKCEHFKSMPEMVQP